METTERIVEAYVRYVKGWATIPNVRCDGQLEIDLLAIDPVTLSRYHIETSVSGSTSFAKLTGTKFDPALLKVRVQKPKMRRTLGYFIEQKFNPARVVQKLSEYGFKEGHYTKVVVTWDWTPDAKVAADAGGIELWDFRKLMRDIAVSIRDSRRYFTDDTLRTINLFARALADGEREAEVRAAPVKVDKAVAANAWSAPYWVYRNWINQRARLHRATCSHCNDGKGTQGSPNSVNGEWKPFPSEAEARAFLAETNIDDAKSCPRCMGAGQASVLQA